MTRLRNACHLALDYLTVAAVYAHGAVAYARAHIKNRSRR
jgi:hypothetical protein